MLPRATPDGHVTAVGGALYGGEVHVDQHQRREERDVALIPPPHCRPHGYDHMNNLPD
jgi:hypothetical protein